ncbi:hypothetical protein HMPREF0758_2632 [Serratia odorifera DSM 4582]|uniref:Uncharacterized protein n=1 Tax=Serratia odorifera DSM 4582 TaxID=667129 RepID=D4E382_SEROD|nr:hypothetical protein HMPREF0758_2632 [Serratia odorifera DSM 4582]
MGLFPPAVFFAMDKLKRQITGRLVIFLPLVKNGQRGMFYTLSTKFIKVILFAGCLKFILSAR